jgi:hypothetical protein
MVAQEANVDAALVVRTFGGKNALFLAAVEWPWDPAEELARIVAGPRSRRGHRIVELFVATWEDPEQRAPILALLRSAAGHTEARDLLTQFVATQLLLPMVVTTQSDQPELRAAFIGAYLVGLGMTRYVLELQPLASMAPTRVIEIAGSIVHRLLTAPLP